MDQHFTYQHQVQDSTKKNWKRQEPYCLALQDIHSQIHCLESHVQHQNHESFLCLSNWECLEMQGVDWVSSSMEKAAVATTSEALTNKHRKS